MIGIWIELGEANLQVHQDFPDERVEWQLKASDEIISVDGHSTEGGSRGHIGWPRKAKLDVIRQVEVPPDQRHLVLGHSGPVGVHVERCHRPGQRFPTVYWVPGLLTS